MYRDQFVLLTKQLYQELGSKGSLNRLLNDGDKRRKMLQLAAGSKNRQLQSLAKRIATLEDLTPYRIRIDCVPETKCLPEPRVKRLWLMVAFALCNLGIIAGSVATYEEVKQQRQQTQQLWVSDPD